MRRNRDYGNGNTHQITGGPLLTTHLRDLDIELELLKRKRDIIQHEQAILSRYPAKRQYNNYEEPHNLYNLQESTHQQFNTYSFLNRYDGPSSSGNFTRPQGAKRQAPVKYWQSPNQKRFAAPQKINPWQISNVPKQDQGFPNRKNFQPQPAIISSQLRPLMSIRPSIGQKIQKNFPTQRKDFRPTKVTKPKNQNQKKPTTNVETKKLVSQATNMLKKTEPDNILRADKPPTVQVKGRMELALGTLMKEIKIDHCSDPVDLEYFQTPFIQRILKQTIRTRIRNVMLDQVVSHVNDVVTRYRKKFPKDTDIDLVKIAKDAQTLSSKKAGVVQLIETDDPQEFYKKNMIKVLGSKLEEMMSNLELLYLKPKKDLVEFMDKMPEPKPKIQEEKAEVTDETNPVIKERITYENIIGECENPKAFSEKLEKVKMYVEFMDELVEQRLPKILPKFKDMLLSILYTDKEVLSMKALLMTQLKKRLVKSIEEELIIESDVTKMADKSGSMPDGTSIFASDDLIFSASPNSDSAVEDVTTEEKDSGKSIDSDKVVTSPVTVTDEKAVSSEKLIEKRTPRPVSTPTKPNKANQSAPATPKTPGSEVYFAKLISRPSLPARSVIYEFLSQFKPTSIKKHKTIGNLLVIGFTNKENYDKILKVNETTIGNATIIIKASEQTNRSAQSTPSEIKIKVETPKSANSSLGDDCLGAELEAEINDLLDSIRQRNADEPDTLNVSEEQDKMDTENNSNSNKISENQETTVNNTVNEANEKVNGKNKDTDEMDSTEKSGIDNVDTNSADIKSEQAVKSDTNEKDETNADYKLQIKNEPELETIEESHCENNDKVRTPEKAESDKIKDLKETGRNTPTRSSSRLANITPSTIRTRRASRLPQNN